MKHSIFILGLFLTLSISQAQTPDVSAKLPNPILETIHSNIVDYTYKVFVSLPPNYSPKEKSYPVLYYLDAWAKTAVLNSAAYSQTRYRQINPVILVGISYDTNFEGRSKIRTRDYVPSLQTTDTVHRADDFLQFIKTELIPYIEGKYAVNQSDRGLLGGSLGGLFCTWVLKQEPELFQKIGIGSPSLWYEDRALFKDEELLDNIKNAKNLNILISCGSLERKSRISNSNQLFNLLKANENIQVSNVLFENENHSTVAIVAYNRALTHFYQNQYLILQNKAYQMYSEKNYEGSIEYMLNAFQLDPEQISVRNRFDLGAFYTLAGKRDEAFEQLYIIAEMKKNEHYETLVKDPDFESLHSDKRWKELVDLFKRLKE